ncbi:MAG: hypothetical protein M3Q87_00920 [Actinomycetota bacterium]|nr:hypothetical protein [Actinomycetota bacterium]
MLVVPLVLVGAAAVAAANLLASDQDGFVALGVPGAIGWLYVPAAAAVVALAGVFSARWRAVGVGLIAGGAAWSLAFWFRITVNNLFAADVGLVTTIEGTVITGLWGRLVGGLLLGAAAVACIKAAPTLGAPVAVKRDLWSLAGGGLAVAGAVSLALEPLTPQGRAEAVPRLVALASTVLAVCVPVAVLRLNAEQRRAALVAATLFLIVPAGRDGWLLLTDDQGAPLATHFMFTVAGSLVTLVGCHVGQAGGRAPPV